MNIESAGIRRFTARELEATDRIARHLGRGGLAVLEGPWNRVVRLYVTLRSKGAPEEALRRLALAAVDDAIPGLWALQHNGYIALEDALFARAGHLHYVDALGGAVTTIHPDVLVPRCQALIHLLRQALEIVGPELPPAPAVLDMGCGSGVCALLAARVFSQARIVAADLLPEAVASTQVNAARFEHEGLIRPGAITAAEPGDLFETLERQRFDLIIFNAPWVAAPARNRMETALNDGGQETLRRFLAGAPDHLRPGGHVIVGYADQSGPKAIANLERFAAAAGFMTQRRLADRIKTHRRKKAWEAIYAYDLGR